MVGVATEGGTAEEDAAEGVATEGGAAEDDACMSAAQVCPSWVTDGPGG